MSANGSAMKRGGFSESVPVRRDGTFDRESDLRQPPIPAMIYSYC